MVVSRFGYEDPKNPATVNRQSRRKTDSVERRGAQVMRCCFHHQSNFRVRTGWALGSRPDAVVGHLHHIKATRAFRAFPKARAGRRAMRAISSSIRARRTFLAGERDVEAAGTQQAGARAAKPDVRVRRMERLGARGRDSGQSSRDNTTTQAAT